MCCYGMGNKDFPLNTKCLKNCMLSHVFDNCCTGYNFPKCNYMITVNYTLWGLLYVNFNSISPGEKIRDDCKMY